MFHKNKTQETTEKGLPCVGGVKLPYLVRQASRPPSIGGGRGGGGGDDDVTPGGAVGDVTTPAGPSDVITPPPAPPPPVMFMSSIGHPQDTILENVTEHDYKL
ncbi:hypothetical protein AAG570_005105 [Ranatra chinensis]|uniref:Uncharacterized protein n=1 Tax=Ranatra chinensis TaxID=642074 RepID=A0ABD0XZT1_9HEMI